MADDTDNVCCTSCGHEVQEGNCKCDCELRPLRDEVFRLERELRVTLTKSAREVPDGYLTQVLNELSDVRDALAQREEILESHLAGSK